MGISVKFIPINAIRVLSIQILVCVAIASTPSMSWANPSNSEKSEGERETITREYTLEKFFNLPFIDMIQLVKWAESNINHKVKIGSFGEFYTRELLQAMKDDYDYMFNALKKIAYAKPKEKRKLVEAYIREVDLTRKELIEKLDKLKIRTENTDSVKEKKRLEDERARIAIDLITTVSRRSLLFSRILSGEAGQ